MTAMDSENKDFAFPWAGEFFLDSHWGYDDAGLAATIKRELSESWPLLRAGALAATSHEQRPPTLQSPTG
ncbi:hypothetical protein OHT76_00590 [Streptomyces sp. NBC_00287]|uniref:hypothetical protein n=1 Tax=Streptomyces sp. NBC_00287 TaxID=2975702 RepID=UPI002E2AB7A5|nr:hypothetical protein [Streptomyces sp. NBC_00287]